MAPGPKILCQPITVLWSDGESPKPPPPGRKVAPGSQKDIDWRRKLGHWVGTGFDSKNEYGEVQFILSEFPKGYELWDHERASTQSNNSAKKIVSDAYLYGYNSNDNRQLKFRSPAEFLPHLVWLARADPRGKCPCKLCRSQSSTKAQAPVSPSVQPRVLKGTASNLVPSPPTKEQRLDSEPNGKYLYRPGELVWFNKSTGTWGLAVISMRQLIDGKPSYRIQPLSHPLFHPPAEIKDREEDLRPWLAWSVPSLGNTLLQNARYDQVPWERIINDYPSDPVVDGSILAAGSIDASYSLFEEDKTALSNEGEKLYRGIYLGGEKIWVGEPVRLNAAQDNEILVLVIKKIIEHQSKSPSMSDVILSGDVWKFTKMPTPIENRDIPARMIEDLNFRNEVEHAAQTGLWSEWRISEPNAKKELKDIKGRWYETKSLLPILRGKEHFYADLAKGVAGDSGMWMNARGGQNVGNGFKYEDRESTFNRAVPPGFKVSRGLDDPAPAHASEFMEIDPVLHH